MKSGIKLAEYPFIPRFMDSNGHRLAYLDEGKGPVVVMLHGNPSWSYLYRKVVRQLQGRYRCIVPDHLGCGFSDKPQEASYSLNMHIHNLEALLQGLGIDRCTLILHDWGGAIGMGWAVRHPAQVAAIVACMTAGIFSTTAMPTGVR